MKLAAVEGAAAVIVIASNTHARRLLQAAKARNLVGRFVWFGTEYWGDRDDVVEGLSDVSRGAFTIVPDNGYDAEFDKFYKDIKPDSDPNNPWLKEFWEITFKCNLEFGGKFERACSGRESLRDLPFKQDVYVTNTINAVLAYVHALTKLFVDKCGGMTLPPCGEVGDDRRTTERLNIYMRNISFIGGDGKPFSFSKGNGIGKYKIFNYQTVTGGHAYVKVRIYNFVFSSLFLPYCGLLETSQ